jgi:hypothetical protein
VPIYGDFGYSFSLKSVSVPFAAYFVDRQDALAITKHNKPMRAPHNNSRIRTDRQQAVYYASS